MEKLKKEAAEAIVDKCHPKHAIVEEKGGGDWVGYLGLAVADLCCRFLAVIPLVVLISGRGRQTLHASTIQVSV